MVNILGKELQKEQELLWTFLTNWENPEKWEVVGNNIHESKSKVNTFPKKQNYVFFVDEEQDEIKKSLYISLVKEKLNQQKK